MKTEGHLERALVRELVVFDPDTQSLAKAAPQKTRVLCRAISHVSESSGKVLHASVRRSLGRLREKGLVVSHEPTKKSGPYTQNEWEITEEGIDEFDRLEDAYQQERHALEHRYGRESPY